jgi:predicted RNase H-like HicB family nuclease
VLRFSAVVTKEGNLYVSRCPELEIASQGSTIEQALSNLSEAIALYLEDPDVKLPEHEFAPLVTFVEVQEVGTSSNIGA